MKISKKQLILYFCILLFLVSLYVSIFEGHIRFGLTDLWNLVTHKNTDSSIILDIIRLPRVFKGIVAGCCLALAGLFMQTITKNPLVEPYITGVSSGAGLALVLGIIFSLPPQTFPLLAFCGAILASLTVITFAGMNKFSLVKLILTGLSINIFAGSIISMLLLTNSDKAFGMMVILSGNLNSSLAMSGSLLFLFIVAMLCCVAIIPKLNFLRLDNNIVSALSSNTTRYLLLIVFLSSYLSAVSVCAAGILGFIGIIIPHISRLLVGQDFKWLFFINILLGSSFVLISDFAARNIIYPMELPLGLVLALVGAPVFVLFLAFKGGEFNV